jgi:ribosomal protein S18 acetylase RimI-like enzyme
LLVKLKWDILRTNRKQIVFALLGDVRIPHGFKGRERMTIRPLDPKDRMPLLAILRKTGAFTSQEIDVALELMDIALKDPHQRDYQFHCLVDDRDEPIGYICYGPVPMTQGTFDLYWIAVDPEYQKQGVGAKLMSVMEEKVRRGGGRMILADTSSIPLYEGTHRFYRKTGFREVARVPDYYDRGNDRITFCKGLD